VTGSIDLLFDTQTDQGEAVLGRWYYRDGDHVEAGTVVCEIMISKAAVEITAPISGRLIVTVAEEQPVTPGTKLGALVAHKR
jgi:pyruvate/2-oxoglutarate dehydrogenase complex dihydrolipoamide acyltransferase (E2) component